MNTWLLPLSAIVAIINIFAFLLYAGDKCAAAFSWWRIPERKLIGAAILGPFGAYAAMRIFRHKIRNPRFSIVPVWLAVQVVSFSAILILLHPLP